MADAGYKWDAEKKEMKKIGQKPDTQHSTEWSVSDFRTWQYIVSDVLTKKDGIGQYLDNGECKKIAKYMQEEWSKRLSTEQKPTWSEEDEHWRQKVIDFMNHPDFIKTIPTLAKDTINWLKSLKDRVHPQSKQDWSKED